MQLFYCLLLLPFSFAISIFIFVFVPGACELAFAYFSAGPVEIGVHSKNDATGSYKTPAKRNRRTSCPYPQSQSNNQSDKQRYHNAYGDDSKRYAIAQSGVFACLHLAFELLLDFASQQVGKLFIIINVEFLTSCTGITSVVLLGSARLP